MKVKFLILVILLLSSNALFAQSHGARIADKIDNFCCEHFRAVLDNFFATLSNDPTSKGLVIFYGGRNHPICTNKRPARIGELDLIIRTVKNHIVFRHFDPNRITTIQGGYRGNWGAEFWIVPNGATQPLPTPTLERRDLKIRRGRSKNINLRCPK